MTLERSGVSRTPAGAAARRWKRATSRKMSRQTTIIQSQYTMITLFMPRKHEKKIINFNCAKQRKRLILKSKKLNCFPKNDMIIFSLVHTQSKDSLTVLDAFQLTTNEAVPMTNSAIE